MDVEPQRFFRHSHCEVEMRRLNSRSSESIGMTPGVLTSTVSTEVHCEPKWGRAEGFGASVDRLLRIEGFTAWEAKGDFFSEDASGTSVAIVSCRVPAI